jgi:hypothetical protein
MMGATLEIQRTQQMEALEQQLMRQQARSLRAITIALIFLVGGKYQNLAFVFLAKLNKIHAFRLGSPVADREGLTLAKALRSVWSTTLASELAGDRFRYQTLFGETINSKQGRRLHQVSTLTATFRVRITPLISCSFL